MPLGLGMASRLRRVCNRYSRLIGRYFMVSGPSTRRPPRRTGFRKQEIDELLGGRLRFVIGEAGAFVSLDDSVMRLVRRPDDEIETDQRPGQHRGRTGRTRGTSGGQMLGGPL